MRKKNYKIWSKYNTYTMFVAPTQTKRCQQIVLKFCDVFIDVEHKIDQRIIPSKITACSNIHAISSSVIIKPQLSIGSSGPCLLISFQDE